MNPSMETHLQIYIREGFLGRPSSEIKILKWLKKRDLANLKKLDFHDYTSECDDMRNAFFKKESFHNYLRLKS